MIIDGQDLVISVEAIDDLGPDGIDRVVFYVNDAPVATEFDSVSEQTGAAALEHVYRAALVPPDGTPASRSTPSPTTCSATRRAPRPVRIGKIEDTVEPELDVLAPADGEILTAAETLELRAGVSDIGVDVGAPACS